MPSKESGNPDTVIRLNNVYVHNGLNSKPLHQNSFLLKCGWSGATKRSFFDVKEPLCGHYFSYAVLFSKRDRPRDRVIKWPSVAFSINVKRRQTLSAGRRRCTKSDEWRPKLNKERRTYVLFPSVETAHKAVEFLFCRFQFGVSVQCTRDQPEVSKFC